jgi:hypothetical protein
MLLTVSFHMSVMCDNSVRAHARDWCRSITPAISLTLGGIEGLIH